MPISALTPPLQSISWGGVRLPDNDIAVYFATAGERFGDYTSEGFNDYVQSRMLDALSTISAVANVAFTVVMESVGAEFRLVLDNNEFNDNLTGGRMHPPGETNAGVGEFNALSGNYSPGGTLERGGSEFLVLVHEFLHGMGLAHPHDDGGGSTIMAGVTSEFDSFGDFSFNQGVYTVMSYNDGYHTGLAGSALDPNGLFGGSLGPAAFDIAILQSLYGANTTTGAGDSVYLMPEANVSGTGWLAIWDVSGTDEIRYDGSGNTTIDLRAATLAQEAGGGGWISAAAGIAGGYTIAHDVVIENATGGSGNDRLTGNDFANILRGNDGNDTLVGGGGDDFLYGGSSAADLRDVIYGGDGNDYIDGGAGNDDLNGGVGRDTILGGLGTDTLIGNEGADVLSGMGGSDLMFGNDGDDFLNGGFGYDRLNGGTGADTFFHLGVADHASDWVQDYMSADGDVLAVGIAGASRSQFQVNFANTAGAGDAGVAEAFVIYRPTGQILWALVDGAGQDSINLSIGGQMFDLLA